MQIIRDTLLGTYYCTVLPFTDGTDATLERFLPWAGLFFSTLSREVNSSVHEMPSSIPVWPILRVEECRFAWVWFCVCVCVGGGGGQSGSYKVLPTIKQITANPSAVYHTNRLPQFNVKALHKRLKCVAIVALKCLK